MKTATRLTIVSSLLSVFLLTACGDKDRDGYDNDDRYDDRRENPMTDPTPQPNTAPQTTPPPTNDTTMIDTTAGRITP